MKKCLMGVLVSMWVTCGVAMGATSWNFNDETTQGWYMGGSPTSQSSVAPYLDPISGSYCLQIHDPNYGGSPWAILDVDYTVQAGATLSFYLKHGVRTDEGYSYEGWVPGWPGHGDVVEIKVALVGPGGTQTLGALSNVLGFIDASTWNAGRRIRSRD